VFEKIMSELCRTSAYKDSKPSAHVEDEVKSIQHVVEDTIYGGTHAKVCEDVLFEVVASYGELTRNYAG
jgi:hypothetical protein